MRLVVPESRWVRAGVTRTGTPAIRTLPALQRGDPDSELGRLRQQLASELAALEGQLQKLDSLLARRSAAGDDAEASD